MEDIIKRLEKLNTTLLADGMNFENVMDFNIQAVNYRDVIVGKARTISAYPGDNLFIHYVLLPFSETIFKKMRNGAYPMLMNFLISRNIK